MSGVDPAWVAGTNFVMLHLDLVDALDGDFKAALLLERIRFRAGDGWWRATRLDLQRETRMGAWEVRRALDVLREQGFVESQRTSSGDSTQRWRIILDETVGMTDSEETSTPTVRKPHEGVRKPPSQESEETSIPTTSKKIEELEDKNSLAILDQPDAFDEFWKAYPRKEGKGQARRAWAGAVKKVTPAQLIVAAAEFRQWCDREGQDKRFIKQPATWLNGECWLDERVSRGTGVTNTQSWIELAQEIHSPERRELQ